MWYRKIVFIRYIKTYLCLNCIWKSLDISYKQMFSLYYVYTKFPYAIYTKICFYIPDK